MKMQIGRALRLRCPNCGQSGQLKSWLKVKDHCNSCGLRFDRGQYDYFIGAYTINLIVNELIVTVAFVIGMLVTWPNVPWDGIMWGLAPLAVLSPLATTPYARSLYLAMDLRFRPPEPADFISA